MATRQYIGARYVPKFYDDGQGGSEHTDRVSYEPLTIVTSLGNSYTSKKAVPVGVSINNREYWALTGAYNEQIEEYRQEVEEIKAKSRFLDAYATFNNMRMVLIGDSFGDAVNSWITKVIANFSLSSGNVYENHVGGAGFSNNGFIDLLNDLAPSVTDADTITHIVVVGGTNDTVLDASDNIRTAIINFVNTATSFFPNAKIYIGFCATLYRNEDLGNGRHAMLTYARYNYQLACAQSGAIFIDNLAEIMNSRDCLGVDNVHPTERGSNLLGIAVTNSIRGCDASVLCPILRSNATAAAEGLSITYTYKSGITSPRLSILFGTMYSGTARTIPVNTWITFVDSASVPMRPMHVQRKCASIKVVDNNGVHIVRGIFNISGSDGLTLLLKTDEGVNYTNVTEITLEENIDFFSDWF